MNDILIREIPFDTKMKEKIQIKSAINIKTNLKNNYVLINNDIIKSKVKNSFLTREIGIKSSEFVLTISTALLLVIISGIIMYFSWRI